MSSSVTEEQRRRMEENRRKALEKRAAAANALSDKTKTGPPKPSMTSVTANQIRPVAQPQATNNVMRPVIASNTTQRPVVRPVAPPFKGKPLTGHCAMISIDRFAVEIGYNPQLVEIFKSIAGSQYDSQTKLWNFPLSEHGKLLLAVEPLRPQVSIGGIPVTVLKNFRNPIVSGNEIDLSRIDPVLVAALMPFQRDGIIFGISRSGKCLIADDMGLGKTIQALGIAHYYYNDWPLLIVCPSSMRFAWREAIWTWLPSVNPGSIFVMTTSKDSFDSSKVVIVSYDLLQRREEDLKDFKVVIMDESHHLKNYKTARSRAATPIIQDARRAILLSGTPALSRPIELFPQISSISRNLFQFNEYGIRYCAGKKTAWGWDFSGSSNMQELHLLLKQTILIRRLKCDVLQQLPPKLRKMVILDPAQIKLASKALKASAEAFNKGKDLKPAEARGKLLEFFSETSKSKLPAVCSYIKDLVEAEKKFIVFAHHRYMMDGMTSALEEISCKYIRIDGATTSENRQFAVEQFQSCEEIKVAILSITAANSGITLTAAGLVVFSELYWNPGILTQAEDRAHRIGQRDSVSVEYLLAKGTADDVLWPMIQEKLNVLNKAGLSKDNFRDADTNKYVVPTTEKKQKDLTDFFLSSSVNNENEPSTSGIESNIADPVVDENFMDEDDELLMQMLDESFN